MGGGMMGRRFGMKKGSKFPDLTGDGKVTFADILKGRGVINGKKKGKAYELTETEKKDIVTFHGLLDAESNRDRMQTNPGTS